MNKKDFKKQFINEFKKENDLKLTFKDTFNNEEINQKNYQHEYLSLKRRFKLTALCSCILICFLIVGLCITMKFYRDNKPDVDEILYLNILNNEEISQIINNCDYINDKPINIINITKNQYLYIFLGYSRDLKSNTYYTYFYKVVNFKKNFEIHTDSLTINICQENTFGLLCNKMDINCLKFTIKYDDFFKNYLI